MGKHYLQHLINVIEHASSQIRNIGDLVSCRLIPKTITLFFTFRNKVGYKWLKCDYQIDLKYLWWIMNTI